MVRLRGGDPPRGSELGRHLAACPACRAYVERVAAARRYFSGHHANVEPGDAFVASVRSRLETHAVELMGRAALRLLPVCLALLVLVGWLAWRSVSIGDELAAGAPAADSSDVLSPTEDLLTWVLEQDAP